MAKFNFTQVASVLQQLFNMVENPDAEPTENSTQLVTSGGVYDAIQAVEEDAKQLSYNSLMEDSVGPASIVTFPDGAENVPIKSLKVDITALQDLHGQPFPYPDGGYKNILDLSSKSSATSNGITFTVNKNEGGAVTSIVANGTATDLARFDFDCVLAEGTYIFSGCPAGGSTSTGYFCYKWNPDYSGDASDIGNGMTVTVPSTYAGQAYHFSIRIRSGYAANNLVFKPMICLSTATDPDYAHFAPYSNICPISGFTGAEITRTGNNLINPSTCVNGLLNQSTGAVQSGGNWVTTDYIKVTGDSVVVSGWRKGSESCFCVRFVEYDENKSWIAGAGNLNVTADQYWTKTRTLHTGAAYVRISFGFDNKTTPVADFFATNNVQLELGTEASPYEAFGTVYSVSWTDEGTVYKGTAEYKGDEEWEITATSAEMTYDGSETWNKDSTDGGARGFYHQQNDLVHSSNYSAKILCDTMRTFAYHVAADYLAAEYGITGFWDAGSNYPTQNWIYAKAVGVTTAAEFKSWLSANPITVVYDLASPATPFIVTGPAPETLLGDNVVFADCGDIEELVYRCNTALYILKKTAE